jgi:hypothetical protein
VVLVGIDRGAVWLATRRIHQQLLATAGAGGPAGAHIGGVPFLTQVVGGTYDNLTVRVASIDTSGIRLQNVDVHLHGVHVGVLPALFGRVRDVPVDHVQGTATLDYADLQAALRRASFGVTLVRVSGDATGLRLTLPLAGAFGAPDSVHVEVSIEDGRLRLHVPNGTASSFTTLVNAIALPLPGLPYGLRLASTDYTTTGVRFTISGTKAVLPSR